MLLGLVALPVPGALAEAPECNDAIDNDSDGYTDYPDDPGCSELQDDTETPSPECDDNIDNDGDGNIDYPDDVACASLEDDGECTGCTDGPMPDCSDGLDNDGDDQIDYPSDPDCTAPEDDSEIHYDSAPECSDGLDNDGDGYTDHPDDVGCWGPGDDGEVGHDPECRDGFDNDGDGATDYSDDPECTSSDSGSESEHVDPECAFNGTGCDGIVIGYRSSHQLLYGAVGDREECMAYRAVLVKKKRLGRDRIVAVTQTAPGGGWQKHAPSRWRGRYYSVAPRWDSKDAETGEGISCDRRRSGSVWVP